MNKLTMEQIRDLKILARFIKLFCHARHDWKFDGGRPIPEFVRSGNAADERLCAACANLLEHGIMKRQLCPLDPKPVCRSCRIHCYTPEYREKIREIMAYSGKHMILRGRLDYLWHYYFNR